MDSTENMMPVAETVAPPEAPRRNDGGGGGGGSRMLMAPPGFTRCLGKKKRGRPRKYDPEGVVVAETGGRTLLSPVPISACVPPPISGGHSEIKFGDKKKVKIEAKPKHDSGGRILSGGSFTPHTVTVNPGEDVTSKIISCTKDGPRSICILSAHGVISQVTLRHANSSVGTVTYEGRFEILSLSGSFSPCGGLLSRETKMSITLSSPDGRVVGGQLGGLLTAAGPVQVIVGSFLPHTGSPMEPKPRKQKAIINPLIPSLPPAESRADMDYENLDEHVRESPMVGNTNSAPTRNFKLEKCATASVHDWRRTATDMNVSLNED